MDPDCSDQLRDAVAAVTPTLGSQIHFYNDGLIRRHLTKLGLPQEEACDYVLGGCCRFELGGVTTFVEKYHSVPHWLLTALNAGMGPADDEAPVPGIAEPAKLGTFADVIEQFRCVVVARLCAFVTARTRTLTETDVPFHFESLLLKSCVVRGRDCASGGTRYVVRDQYFAGVATVANSLMAIKQLVYDEKRFTLSEFLDIVKRDFEGHNMLREEILRRIPKFGNDQAEVDAIARRVGEIILDVLDSIPLPPDHLLVPGFYSLMHHHTFARGFPATADGRLRGEPFSENQSPSYGTDTKGMTALLKSVARLPLDRTAQGGLNVTFGSRIPAANVRSLIDSYFGMGGLHIGFSFVDRQALLDAREHPERYRTLTVRMYGFSEYFVSLAPFEQQELIERTRH